MQKSCGSCQISFEITEEDLAFYDKVSPMFAGKKYPIPPPTLCPDCRMQRRMAWRNDRHLYERKCDFSQASLVSMFRPDSKVKVYHKDIWWKEDAWDPLQYGRAFDFSRPFFDQFTELLQQVPYAHVVITQGDNNLYTNYNMNNKNCYLCFAGNNLEDSMYCYNAENSKDCVDCLFVSDSELLYQCVQCEHCYNTQFSLHSKNCSDSFFLEDCQSCSNCFMCWNLDHKQYYIENKAYSKEEYEKIVASYKLNTHEGLRRAWENWREKRLQFPKKENRNIFSENSTGEYITQSKNCRQCYNMAKGSQDCRYVLNAFPGLKDAMDCTFCGENAELLYECMASGANEQRILFGNIVVMGGNSVLYCNTTFNSKDCFGCTNIRNKQYCILNKQYTKEEYNNFVPLIIEHMLKNGEWGEFFPARSSPFGYNESLAAEYFPLTKKRSPGKRFHLVGLRSSTAPSNEEYSGFKTAK